MQKLQLTQEWDKVFPKKLFEVSIDEQAGSL